MQVTLFPVKQGRQLFRSAAKLAETFPAKVFLSVVLLLFFFLDHWTGSWELSAQIREKATERTGETSTETSTGTSTETSVERVAGRAADGDFLYYYRLGEKAANSDNYRTAIQYYRQALERKPRHIASHLKIAQAYIAVESFSKAEAHYRQLSAWDSNNWPARIGLAMTYIAAGRLQQARPILLGLYKEKPADLQVNYGLGLLALRSERLQQAQLYFQRVIRRKPSHFSALAGLAEVELSQGHFSQAKDYLRQARLRDADNAAIYLLEGQLYLRQALLEKGRKGRDELLERAKSFLQAAMRETPRSRTIQRQLIYLDLYRGDLQGGMKQTLSLLKSDPQDREWNYLMAYLQLQQLNPALRISQEEAKAKRASQSEKIDFRKISDHLQKVLQKEPQDSLARMALEEALLSANQSPESAPRRQLADHHYRQALAFRKRYRRQLSNIHLRRSLLLNRFHKPALKARLEYFRRQGDYEGFLSLLLQLRKMEPQNASLHYRLEKSLQRRWQYIAYRENLFNPTFSTEQATFQRTPLRLFIFDFRPENLFPRYPDGGRLLANALTFVLDRPAPLTAGSVGFRLRTLDRIAAQSKESWREPWGTHYNSAAVSHLAALEGEKNSSDYVLSGSYRTFPSGRLELQVTLIDKVTAVQKQSIRLSSDGPNALVNLVAQAADSVSAQFSPRGQIVKIDSEKIYINLGRYDGVNSQARFRIAASSGEETILEAREVGAYLTRLTLPNFKLQDRVRVGHQVELLR